MDVIKDGIDGFIVEYGDIENLRKKMRLLMDDENLRKQMGSSGKRKTLREYIWPVIVDKIESIYEESLN